MIVTNAKKLTEDPKSTYFSIEGAIDQTVVFIDEVDKLAKSYGSSDGWHTQIQAGLLSMLENQESLKNVSFIFAGAFSQMDFEPEKQLGFGAMMDIEERTIADVTDAEVIEYGLIPELVGRIGAIDVLDTLTPELMEDILVNKLLPIKNRDLSYMGCELLILSKDDIEEVISKAMTSGQGIRALKREVNKMSLEAEFDYEEPTMNTMMISGLENG
jgi:ATP-dependent Clp protease ATP-binding subunit ClpX